MSKTRRDFLSLAGKSLGLAAVAVPTIGALLKEVEAASRSVAHLAPEQVAMDEDYWSVIQNSFTVTRGIVNLNNGGVSPSPRIVTEALAPVEMASCSARLLDTVEAALGPAPVQGRAS